jgi:hypothetical protein
MVNMKGDTHPKSKSAVASDGSRLKGSGNEVQRLGDREIPEDVWLIKIRLIIDCVQESRGPPSDACMGAIPLYRPDYLDEAVIVERSPTD